ncbi:MAG: ribonuclease HII [Candidatus Odinarchaeia archaeon]
MKRCLKVSGIDEAGRGPIIGPMVIGGVLITEDKIQKLIKLGVRDSKLLNAMTREKLACDIAEIVDKYILIEISPAEIDESVKNNRLNFLEAEKTAYIINQLKPDIVYVDAPQLDVKRYSGLIKRSLNCSPKIIAENKAERYPVVAAASILAKVKRDKIVETLKETYGEFGSGYCHDAATRKFLIEWYRKNKCFPDIVRKSWSTVKEIITKYDDSQRKIL